MIFRFKNVSTMNILEVMLASIFTSWCIYAICRHKIVNAYYYKTPIGFTLITINLYRLKTMNL